jgi:hypothetical protein
MRWLKLVEKLLADRIPCMNDTKWREVFGILAIDSEILGTKVVGVEEMYFAAPPAATLIYENGLYMPQWDFVPYREIEFVFVPRVYETGTRHEGQLLHSALVRHDVENTDRKLRGLGLLMVHKDEGGLTIFGYAPLPDSGAKSKSPPTQRAF